MAVADSSILVDENLRRFWGRKMKMRDIAMCSRAGLTRTCELENGAPLWCLRPELNSFNGCVHLGKVITEYWMDKTLIEYTFSQDFSPMRGNFGSGENGARRMILLVLIRLVKERHATYSSANHELSFECVGTSLPSLSELFEQDFDGRANLEREGRVIGYTAPDGCHAYMPTARGFCCEVPDTILRTAPRVQEMIIQLEARALMRRESREGQIIWNPTPAGRKIGLASDWSIRPILERLGLDELLYEESGLG